MPRYAYVNGQYLSHAQACVHIEDRGYQFADSVYEVIGCIHGRFADERGHLDRLERSMAELEIVPPVSRQSLQFIMRHLLRLNKINSAALYIQITRGEAPRDFKCPSDVQSSLVLTCRPFHFDHNAAVEKGVKIITVPDQRWARPDIKTTGLLPQVLARQAAVQQGVSDAWMVGADGLITEGSASNAWIYDGQSLITHKNDGHILKGVTRTAIFEIAEKEGIAIEERSFSAEEAYKAKEAFASSATALLVPVIEIDDHKIGNGAPGPLVQKIYKLYRSYVDEVDEEGQVQWTA